MAGATAGEHFDVIIVGAGISGVGAGCRLQELCPGRSFAILEAREAIGGTWDLFRFPGIRSDSDMTTLSYPFRPWTQSRMILDGGSIREYVQATAREHGIDRRIRFGRRVQRATWSSRENRWTLEVQRSETGESERLTCAFLFTCTGYYRYEAGYTPEFPGLERFRGEVVHPQHWPEDLDYANRRVVVIGSGATAVTAAPALAARAAHVTMLQRSPSYVLTFPAEDPIVRLLTRVLPERLAYGFTRWRNAKIQTLIWNASRRWPRAVRRALVGLARRQLPEGFDIATHFSPRYDPWDERMCIAADGDFFKAIKAGRVSVLTDQIDGFTERGVALRSGGELEADVIVTATGLQLQPLGGIELSVDGRPVDLSQELAYRGAMISEVPNLAFAFGYVNQSWTLGADLTAQHICRLLNHMAQRGYARCTPRKPPGDGRPESFFELSSGYVRRGEGLFPRQRADTAFYRPQHYARDRRLVLGAPVEDPALEFSRASAPALAGTRAAVAPAAASA
jgi:monooxygenase